METNKIMLLLQLVNRLEEAYKDFEKAYNDSNKESFDHAKKIIIELSNKINLALPKQAK